MFPVKKLDTIMKVQSRCNMSDFSLIRPHLASNNY